MIDVDIKPTEDVLTKTVGEKISLQVTAKNAATGVLFFFVFVSTSFEIFAEDEHLLKSSQEVNQRHTIDHPLLLVHYMPWFQGKPIRNNWGWHWTMNHFNPDNMDSTGRREIASHYYPLTGPYDSNDEKILEYQVLLMKLSGIDGVIADWYGIKDFFDYALINESTNNIFRYAQKADLVFCVTYEDQTIKHMVNNNHLEENQAISHGQEVMRYLEKEWFNDDLYVKLDNRPVLLTFGPQYFFNSSEWETLFSVLNTSPHFFTLNNRLNPVATGAFPWPPMWKSVDGVLSDEALNEFLDTFYQESVAWEYLFGGAFPGFHDIYFQAGLGFTYGFLDADSGKTFTSTLQKSLENNSDIVQIITWNDFGEGTNIEPAIEYGYQYLELVQSIRKTSIDTSFAHTSEDLLLPFQIYELRIKHENDPDINAMLDEAFNFIISDDLESAITIIESIASSTDVHWDDNTPTGYSLEQNHPNPFNPQTTIFYGLGKSGNVKLLIYNVAGQLVKTLIDANQTAGNHSVIWDANGLVSGLYFCKITAGNYSAFKKCVILK